MTKRVITRDNKKEKICYRRKKLNKMLKRVKGKKKGNEGKKVLKTRKQKILVTE